MNFFAEPRRPPSRRPRIGQRVAKLLAIKLCTCTLFGLYGRRMCNRLWPRFENARGQIILKVSWPVILQPFDLQTPNFEYSKIQTLFKLYQKFKRLVVFYSWVFPCQSDHISIVLIDYCISKEKSQKKPRELNDTEIKHKWPLKEEFK